MAEVSLSLSSCLSRGVMTAPALLRSQHEDSDSPGRATYSPVGVLTPLSLHAGLAPYKALDGSAFTSILYGNGPGYKVDNGVRSDVTENESGECIWVAQRGSRQRELLVETIALNAWSCQAPRRTGSRRQCRWQPRRTAART
jgi:hypothetical protein